MVTNERKREIIDAGCIVIARRRGESIPAGAAAEARCVGCDHLVLTDHQETLQIRAGKYAAVCLDCVAFGMNCTVPDVEREIVQWLK